MHGRWRRLREPDKALAYLRQSVVNRSRSVLRHRGVERRHAPTLAADDPAPTAPPRPRAAYAGRGALRAGRAAERQREVLVLRYYLDLDEAGDRRRARHQPRRGQEPRLARRRRPAPAAPRRDGGARDRPTRDPAAAPDDDLRALLDDAVADVDPTPALDQIRDRTKATPMSNKRPWIYGALGAAVATAATVVAVTVLTDDDTTPVAGPGDSPPSATAEPSTSRPSRRRAPTEPIGEPTDEPSEPPGSTTGRFRSTTSARPRPASGCSASSTALPGDPATPRRSGRADRGAARPALDPDYRSDWGEGTRRPASASTVSTAATSSGIGLATRAALHDRPAGMSQERGPRWPSSSWSTPRRPCSSERHPSSSRSTASAPTPCSGST